LVFFFVACGELLVLSLTIFVACGELTQLPLLIWAGVIVGRGDLLLVSFFGVFFVACGELLVLSLTTFVACGELMVCLCALEQLSSPAAS